MAFAVLAAAGAGYGWMQCAPRRTPAGQPAMERLDAEAFPALREAFNASIGTTRVIVLLSLT